MESVSETDRLAMLLAAEVLMSAKLRVELATANYNTAVEHIKQAYKLGDGDEVLTSGEIKRKPKD